MPSGSLPTAARNERLKQSATFLNNLAVAALVTSVIAPSALAASLAWLASGIVLRLAGRYILKGLMP